MSRPRPIGGGVHLYRDWLLAGQRGSWSIAPNRPGPTADLVHGFETKQAAVKEIDRRVNEGTQDAKA